MSESFQLIPVSTSSINDQTTLTCDGRALHAFLESRQHFTDWIKKRIEKYGFTEGVDFIIHKKMINENNCLESTYFLTIDMAKQLAMVENNEKGLQVRRYFIECERIAKAEHLKTPPEPQVVRVAQSLPIYKKVLRVLEAIEPARVAEIHALLPELSLTQIRWALKDLCAKKMVRICRHVKTGNGNLFDANIWAVTAAGRNAPPKPKALPAPKPRAAKVHPWAALANAGIIVSEEERQALLKRLEDYRATRQHLCALVRDIARTAAKGAAAVENLTIHQDNKALKRLASVLDLQSCRWHGFDSSVFTVLDGLVNHCWHSVNFIYEAQRAAYQVF